MRHEIGLILIQYIGCFFNVHLILKREGFMHKSEKNWKDLESVFINRFGVFFAGSS